MFQFAHSEQGLLEFFEQIVRRFVSRLHKVFPAQWVDAKRGIMKKTLDFQASYKVFGALSISN
jgi:hypothetical protein